MVRVGPYELGATLGRGNYGLVKLAVHRETGEQSAIKIVKKEMLEDDGDSNVDIKREIGIMKALDHPNIVSLKDVLYSPKRVFMVMELVRGGELFESIVKNGKQDEDVARKYFQQLIDAVHYCHHRGVYHRYVGRWGVGCGFAVRARRGCLLGGGGQRLAGGLVFGCRVSSCRHSRDVSLTSRS